MKSLMMFFIIFTIFGCSSTPDKPPVDNTTPCTYASYYKQRPDVQAAGIDAFAHYTSHGKNEGMCRPINVKVCSYAEYYRRRPDVKAAGIDALAHFESNGENEGMCYPEKTSSSKYTLTVKEGNNRLTITSDMPPTWKVVFAVGGGRPGGGNAIQLFIPSNSNKSVVIGTPNVSCCSGLGLGNLEWRWRPWGGTNGTRAALGLSSNISHYKITEQSAGQVIFEMNGSFSGVQSFSRKTIITPKGFTTNVEAEYSGTTGKDSMWWLPMALDPSIVDGDNISVKNADGSTSRMYYTTPRGPKMTKLVIPYEFTFPLFHPSNHSIKMKVSKLAEGGGGNPNNYEFFHKDHNRGVHLFYPRWNGSFSHINYSFLWEWKFANE